MADLFVAGFKAWEGSMEDFVEDFESTHTFTDFFDYFDDTRPPNTTEMDVCLSSVAMKPPDPEDDRKPAAKPS